MAIVSDVEIRLRADIARLQQDMNAMRRTVDQGMQGITRAANLAKAALGGIVAGVSIGALVKQVVDAQREFDKLNASLVTATGSTANAAQAFGALQKFAATTPYSVQEATEAFIKLRNLGLNPSEAALRSYGNTASSQGKSLNQFIEAVADAATGEFERLKEFGIKAKQNGDLVSLTFQGVTKTIGNSSKEIQEYLRKIGDVDFAGAMDRRANTLDGAISNLGDTWDSFLRKVASNGVGESLRKATTQLGGALSDLGVILDAVGGKAEKEGKAVSDAGLLHTTLTGIFKVLGHVGVFLSNALGGVADSVVALASASYDAATGDLSAAKKTLEEASKAGQERLKGIPGQIKAVWAASAAKQAAQDAETQNLKKNTGEQLGQYEVVLNAQQKREKADQDSLEIRNRLNGVNAQTAGDLKKLKEALDTGAISQAQYNKFVGQISKETTLASTAYKDQVKALDLSAAAIKRRADAQAFANEQEQLRLSFMQRSGQMSDADYISKSAAADIKALQESKAALEQQAGLESRKVDNRQKVLELNAQIAEQDQKIGARRIKQDQDEFELKQKLYREAVGNTADLIEAAQAEAKAQKDRTRDQQDEIDMLGMTEKQIAEVTAARLRDQAAALDRRAEIGIIDEVNDKLHEQAEELRKQADLGLTKQSVQEQQKFWGDVEDTAHQTFLSFGDGGKNAFQRLKDSAKNIFFEWLYQMTLKKWIINIGASVDGPASVAGIAKGGSSLLGGDGSILGSISALKGLAGGDLGTGFLGSLVGGLNGAGAGAPLGSALGVQIGNTIADTLGPTLSGALSTGISGLATALPWVGGAVAVYSLAKAAFGMGPKQYADSSTLAGTLGTGGFSGSVNTAWTQKGGWLRSNKSGTDKAAVDAVTASGLSATYDAIKDATSAYAKVLGLNADSIANRTQTVSIALGKDEAANQKAIADFFSGVSDAIAAEVLPSISEFQAKGETAGATLQRVSADFQSFNALMEKVGVDVSKAFGTTGIAAIQARERIIALAGGLDQLGTQTEFYYTNFLSAIEKVGPLQKQVTDQLAALGVPWIKSVSDYRLAVEHLVNSGEAATESGAALYAGLIKLAPTFKTLNDAIQEINQANVDSALASLGRAVDSQKNIVSKAYNDAMTVLDGRINGLNETISRTTELSQELKSAMQGIDTPQASEYSRRAAQAQITAFLAIAKAGDALPNVSDIRDAVSALGNDSSGMYSTLADYQRDVARTNNELAELGGLSDGQLSVAEQQLAVLQAQKDQAASAYDAEIARLDSLTTKAQEQLDIIKGVDVSIKSIDQALAIVNSALQTFADGRTGGLGNIQPVNNSSGSVFDSLLGRVFGNTVPSDNSTISYGTMSGSSASMQSTFDKMEQRLASIEASNQSTAQAVNKFANQFENVSAGGNALLVEQAQ